MQMFNHQNALRITRAATVGGNIFYKAKIRDKGPAQSTINVEESQVARFLVDPFPNEMKYVCKGDGRQDMP